MHYKIRSNSLQSSVHVGRKLAILLLLLTVQLCAQPITTRAADVADLQEQLEKGLRARLPHEFAFVKRVVAKVGNGANQVPLSMVKSTFQWARREKQPYPFPYFEKALLLRAKKKGVAL